MPAVVKIDPSRRIVLSTCYGRMTDQELIGHRTAIAAEPHFSPNYADVIDLTGATLEGPSEDTMIALASQKSLFLEEVPHVIVAPAGLYELACKFRDLARSSRPNLYAVRTLDEAYAILREHGFH